MNGFDFSGRVAVITGGSTGIGAATALILARNGADIVLASRKAERLTEKAAELQEQTGRRCMGVPTDVRDRDQVKHLFDRTVGAFGRVDILVNNAGGSALAALKDLTPKMWDRSFSLNVDSAYYCTKEAGEYFRQQGSGAIVNVSSMAGINGTKGGAHYSAAKSALQMFTRVAASEWGPYGIRVNCVAPGLIASELAVAHWEQYDFDTEAATADFPLRRVGKPEEVANAIVFFASDAAAYITGQVLCVDGGPRLGGMIEE